MRTNFGNELKIDFGNINLNVNPALEFLGVIFVLSNFKLNKIRTNKKYIELVKKQFIQFENHEVITTFKSLLKNNTFKYDAPVELMLNIFYKVKPSTELLQRANLTSTEYKKLVNQINDFVCVSDFNNFFENNKSYYLHNLKQFKTDMLKFNPEQYLFEFLGLSSKKLNVTLMFGITTSNYGINVNKNLYCCARPYKETRFDGEIDYAYNLPYTTTLILHEFAHSFINPLTDKYKNVIKQINESKFKKAFDCNSYGTHKETVINESIIRAIECKFVEDNFENSDYDKLKQDYLNDGFEYIPKLEELYKTYLTQRNKFKTIKKFYPQIIDLFVND